MALPERGRPAASWRASVFGLDAHGSFAAPGLTGLSAGSGLPRVDVACVGDSELAGAWRPDGASRIAEWQAPDGKPAATIDWHPDAGYRIFAAGYGDFVVSATGSRIQCAPAAKPAWQWQRYLIGQLLPIAAVLGGREVFHASAIATGDRVIGLVAGSRVGKTSLALNLVLRGHRFVTDDVLALELRDGVPVVHPGPAVTNLREAERARMGGAADRLGEIVGRDAGSLRIVLERESAVLPLGALYLLERSDAGAEPEFAPVSPDFRLLLENSFDFLVTSEARMRRLLDFYAEVAARVPVFRVSIPPIVTAAELAVQVELHAQSLSGVEKSRSRRLVSC